MGGWWVIGRRNAGGGGGLAVPIIHGTSKYNGGRKRGVFPGRKGGGPHDGWVLVSTEYVHATVPELRDTVY